MAMGKVSTQASGRDGGRRRDVLALASFVALGLPDGMLGTAWPSMRRQLHAPVGDLGLVLLAATAGALSISALVALLIRRFGLAGLMAAGGISGAAGALGFVLSPVLGVLIGVAALFGASAGLWDGAMNTAVALSGRQRLLNLLHGFYGVGTAIGPLLVTAAVLLGSWRSAYAVLVAVNLAIAGMWFTSRRADKADGASPMAVGASAPAHAPDGLRSRRAAIVAGVVVFFLYTGFEVSAGQWETTFGRDHLHLSTATAGLATFGYWAALTAVRLSLGALPRRPGALRVVRSGAAVALVGAGMIWSDLTSAVVVVGFLVIGAGLAGIFPSLVALTPLRLGEDDASRVIAWQVGAASAGGAGMSALVGLAIGIFGLAVLGLCLLVLAVALGAAIVVLDRVAPAREGTRA